MTGVFTGVVSSKTLGGTCAREYLGHACIADTGYSCTCTNVASTGVELVEDANGAVLALTIELAQYIHDTKPLTNALSLTGYRSAWQVTGANLEHGVRVRVEYDLHRAENRRLRQHVLDTGL